MDDDDDDDSGDCADPHTHSPKKKRHRKSSSGSGTVPAAVSCCCLLAAVALVALLVAAYAFVVPVRVTVDDAALGRLALAARAPSTSCIVNGSCTGGVIAISYDLSVGVALHNRNWAMAVWRRGALHAKLRFRGRTFARARLAGCACAGRDRIPARRMEVYRLAAAAEGAPVALGPVAAAELARQSAAGVFELELFVFGEAKYEAHPYPPRHQGRLPAQALAVHRDGAGRVREGQVRACACASTTTTP